MTADEVPLLSTAEAAERLGVKPATLYAYVSRGLLSRVRGADGRTSFFHPAELELMATQPRTPAAGGAIGFPVQSAVSEVRDQRLYYRGRDACELARTASFEAVAGWLWSSAPLTGVRSTSSHTTAAPPTDGATAGAARPGGLPTGDARPGGQAASIRPGSTQRRPTGYRSPGAHPSGARAGSVFSAAVNTQPALTFASTPEFAEIARAASVAVGGGVRIVDRIRTIVSAVGAADPLRADLRPDAVMITAATIIGAVVDGLPRRAVQGTARGAGVPGSIAQRLWAALTELPAHAEAVAPLETALVLLADHPVTASTLAARVAASARAHPYAAVGAALYALDGPIESGETAVVHRTLVEAERDGSVSVVARLLDEANQLPGFGHPLYPDGDPRGRTLIDVLAAQPPDHHRWHAVEQFLATSRRGRPLAPTIDFGVAALTFTAGMPADAGLAILAVARCAGWVAHTLEEYAEEPDRFRPPDPVRRPRTGSRRR